MAAPALGGYRSKQHGDGVVNMTRAIEAVSPLLKHPRRTILKVEGLVLAAALLLLLQLILGSCRRRWHNSLLKFALLASTKLMDPLIIYTLGTMQSSPIKNSSYPVWAAFLILASAGTTSVRQYGFCDTIWSKYILVMGDYLRDAFYVLMFVLLMDPNNYTSLKTVYWELIKQHAGKYSEASSYFVFLLLVVVLVSKFYESLWLAFAGHSTKERRLFLTIIKIFRRMQEAAAESTTTEEETTTENDHPQSIQVYKYTVCYRLCGGGLITIDQIWDSYGNSNSADANAMKDLCLSYALSRWLVRQRYFGLVVYPETSRLSNEGHNFVFKKLLPSDSEVDVKRAFRIIEVELGFCYDFFFTKYYYTFFWTNFLPVPFLQSLVLVKIILILMVGGFAIRRSLVLETPNPIIEVRISEADYMVTLVVLFVALIVELTQAALYLASNWAQVSLACSHASKRCCRDPSLFILGKLTGFLRRVTIQAALRNKIDQQSVIFPWKRPDPVEVSDAVKKAIARSLRSTYASSSNLTTNGTTSVSRVLLQNQMFDENYYSWALSKDLSRLQVMLIWHIATEYCDIISDDSTSNRNRVNNPASSSHLCARLFGCVLELLRPDPTRLHNIAGDHHGHHDVAVHLSRYYTYLIGSVPELLPYHEANITELGQEVLAEHVEIFGFFAVRSEIYSKMKNLQGTEEEDDCRKMFQKGVKLGKQLQRMPDAERWKMLADFWAEMIIHAAASPYTSKQHMQHLENGGQFITHVWALLSHAGVIGYKDHKGQGNLHSARPAAA